MKRSSALVLAIAMAVILSIPFVPSSSEAQMTTDMVSISTDYELLGFSDLHGGGHLTYELTGQAAGDLRRAVLSTYDGLVTGTANGRIDPAELKLNEQTGYIAAVETVLANQGFFSAATNRYEPLHEGQGEDITADAQGFYEVTNIASDDTTPIRIYLYFDATRMNIVDLNFPLLSRALANAIYSPFMNANGVVVNQNINLDAYTFMYKHTDYRICVGSLSGQSLSAEGGSMHVVRTPAGEIASYSVTFDYGDIIMDNADYYPFNFLESPQVLFVLMFICAYLMSTMPTRMYANYKYAYPRRFRHKALKITWLHISSKLAILLLIIFYFFPTMFAFISPSFFMSGLFLWILGIALAVTFSVLAKILYDQKANNIPEEHLRTPTRKIAPRAAPPQPATTTPAGFNLTVNQGGQQQQPRQRQIAKPPAAAPKEEAKPTGPPCKVCEKPITDFVDLLKCKCGSLFHESCAEVAQHCTSCGSALVEIEPEGPVMKDVQCPTCGEMNSIEDDVDPLKAKCAACGVILEKLDDGYNYLVVSNEHKTAFEMFVSMMKSGCTGLSISTTFPDKLKKEHDMAQAEVVWLTDTSVADKKTINPHRLEFEMMRMYASFVKGNPKSVIILDGFEYLVVENGFDKVFKFIKKINDLSSVNSATLFVPIGTDSLEPDQLGTLKKEFDKVMDMTED